MKKKITAEKKVEYFMKTDIKKRGWTDAMIGLLLGAPDKEKTHHSYKKSVVKLYLQSRVLEAEDDGRFLEAVAGQKVKKERQKDLRDSRAGGAKTLLNQDSYLSAFALANGTRREVVVISGPTNSGKTHDALGFLGPDQTCAYLCPLRLLALEKYEDIKNLGLPCNLVTGEEILDNHARITSQTIETFDTSIHYDVVIIDEFQMIFDEERGWAWTRAFLGASCGQLVVVGSSNIGETVRMLTSRRPLKDEVSFKEKQRLVPLGVEQEAVSIGEIKKGDLVVAFSRRDVFTLKQTIENGTKLKCSVIYGALSPGVRKRQAQLFDEGTNDVAVATDAIGMGLNLAIRRVVFYQLSKFDGDTTRPLRHDEIRQIAGRAGRFGRFDQGWVSSLNPRDLRRIGEALTSTEEPNNHRVKYLPSSEQITAVSRILKTISLKKILLAIKEHGQEDADMELSSLDAMIAVAGVVDSFQMSLAKKLTMLHVPINLEQDLASHYFMSWCKALRDDKREAAPDPEYIQDILETGDPGNGEHLRDVEDYAKILSGYRTLCLKAVHIFDGLQDAVKQSETCDQYVTAALHKKIYRVCISCARRLRQSHRHRECEACYLDRTSSYGY